MGCPSAWRGRQSVPHTWLGTNAFWRNSVQRLLSWRAPRPMSRTLYYGMFEPTACTGRIVRGSLPRLCPVQGSGFIAYGVIMAILLLVGEMWVRRSGRSPEWWDSWVIMLWVCCLVQPLSSAVKLTNPPTAGNRCATIRQI